MVRGSVYFVNCSVVLAPLLYLSNPPSLRLGAFAFEDENRSSSKVRMNVVRFVGIYNSAHNLHILIWWHASTPDIEIESYEIEMHANVYFVSKKCEFSFETLCATALTFWSDSRHFKVWKSEKAQNECTNDDDKKEKKFKWNLQQRNPLAMTSWRYGRFTA